MTFLSKKNLTVIVSLFLLLVLLLPAVTQARLVDCSLSTTTGIVGNNEIGGGCDFKDFIALINGIINWIIGIAGVIFTISFIYGGFLYMTSGDNPGNKSKATDILWNTLKGFVIILISWLIVYTIIHYLVDPGQEDTILKFLK